TQRRLFSTKFILRAHFRGRVAGMSDTQAPRTTNNKNPDLLSARIPRSLLDQVDNMRSKRTRADGKPMNRTDAVLEALTMWSVNTKNGAYYPSERERAVFDGLRRRSLSHPLAVDALFDLAEAVARFDDAALALERLIPLLRVFDHSESATTASGDNGAKPRRRRTSSSS